MTKDHGLCKRRLHDDEPYSIVSLLRKKLQEHSRTLQRESASVTSLTNSETDPLLFSFVNNSTRSHEPQADSFAEPSLSKILPKDETSQRYKLLSLFFNKCLYFKLRVAFVASDESKVGER